MHYCSMLVFKCKDCGSIEARYFKCFFYNFLRVFSLSFLFSVIIGFLYSMILITLLNIDLLGNIQSTALMFIRIITLIFLFFGVVNGELVKNYLIKKKQNISYNCCLKHIIIMVSYLFHLFITF